MDRPSPDGWRPKIRRERAILLVVLVVMAVAFAWVGIPWAGRVGRQIHGAREGWRRAPEALPVLQALEHEHVRYLRTDDWCQVYDDGSGVRANDVSDECVSDGGRLFDDAARSRYDQLAERAEALPYAMEWLKIEYRDQRMVRAEIELDEGDFSAGHLVYEPGYSLPKSTPGEQEFHALTADWYYVWEDWN